MQLIPSEIKWDPNATPPQYTDNIDQMIEKGTHLRVKLIGTRSDVGSMFAIGSIKEDFLGSALCLILTRAVTNWIAGRYEKQLTEQTNLNCDSRFYGRFRGIDSPSRACGSSLLDAIIHDDRGRLLVSVGIQNARAAWKPIVQ